MNSFLYVKVNNCDTIFIIKKLSSINVAIQHIYEENNTVYFKIIAKDYSKIVKNFKNIKFIKVKYTGINYLYYIFKHYYLIIVSLLLSFFIIIFASFFIVEIDVIHQNDYIVEIVKEELEQNNVKEFSFRKSYKYLEKVKESIKKKYPKEIDWLEINKNGMKYIVKVEERKVTSNYVKESYCHIYASKDGLIKKIKIYEGVSNVSINDYVKKGDLLVTGDVSLNENIVSKVCSDGDIFAEVWYEIKIKVPFKYYDKVKTGKKRNNIVFSYNNNNYKLLKNRIKDFESEKKIIFDALGVKVYLQKDYEIIKKEKKYSVEEAINHALKLSKEKVLLTLKKDEYIVSQNVLQKSANDSTIEVDIFVITEEKIGQKIVIKGE